MKKIISIISAGALLLSAASCVKEEQKTFDPSQASAPVLGGYTVDEEGVAATFTPAVFNMGFNENVPVNHSLVLVSANGTQLDETVSSTVTDNTITATASTLKRLLVGKGFSEGDTVALELLIRATLDRTMDNGSGRGRLDSEGRITGNFTIAVAPATNTLPDLDGYGFFVNTSSSTIYTEGALALYGWYSGLSDANDLFGGWPGMQPTGTCTLDGESYFYFDLGAKTKGKSVNFIINNNNGGSQLEDFDVFKDQVINRHFFFKITDDSVEAVDINVDGDGLPKIDLDSFEYSDEMEGAEVWGLIGPAVSDWSNDVDMTKVSEDPEVWKAENVPFQADKFKFRGNHAWSNYDLGGAEFALETPLVLTKGGGDIAVPAGVYNVYLYPGYKLLYVEEGSGETPTPPAKPSAWSLIGTLDGTSWDTDFDLTNVSGDVWQIRNVTLTASDEFKIRADHDWSRSVGGPEGNATSAIEEGKEVYRPVLGETFAAGDKNIQVGVEGAYDVTFDYAANTILIEEYKEFPEHLYMIGEEFGGWSWDSDGVVEMVPVLHNPDWGAEAPGQFWTVRYFTADKGFKFCAQKAWNGDFWGLTTNEGFNESGGNCVVAESGFYMVHIDLKREIVHVEPARIYGIGDCFGGWDEEMESALFTASDGKLAGKTTAEGELRLYAASSISTSAWWTREFIFFNGQIAYRGAGGDQDRITVEAGKTVSLDFNAGTASVE